MNQFEKNLNNKRSDVADAGVGFIVSFVFFAAMFTLATVIQVLGS